MKNYNNLIRSSLLATILILSHAANISCMENNKNTLFERGSGFWSTPNDEAKKTFFSKLTNYKSQREDWYKVSPYIAEFWCAISNAGFIYVGLKHNSPALLAAGTASAISHTIPKQWLLYPDKIGVLLVLAEIATKNYDVILKNPWMAAPLAIAGGINLMDMYLARYKGKTWPHVAWHLSAAVLADLFLTYAKQS
jgi:hypothetical protein